MRPSHTLLLSAIGDAALTYTAALTRAVSPAFAHSAVRSSPRGKPVIDQGRAVEQHLAYSAALRDLLGVGGEVSHVPAAAGHPDCVFIEDCAVVLGRTALITRPGHASRRGETEGVEAALKARGLLTLHPPPGAHLDGGDVLWTGREFVVGLTGRTNAAGAGAVARAFPGTRVTTVPLASMVSELRGKGRAGRLPASTPTFHPLHLKSVITLAGPSTLVTSDTPIGNAVALHVNDASAVPKARRAAGEGLSFLIVPDAAAANVVYANGRLLTRESTTFPASAEVFLRFAVDTGMPPPLEVDTSELAKADGALTCCSLLLH